MEAELWNGGRLRVLLEHGKTLVPGQTGKEELTTGPEALMIQDQSPVPGQTDGEVQEHEVEDLLREAR